METIKVSSRLILNYLWNCEVTKVKDDLLLVSLTTNFFDDNHPDSPLLIVDFDEKYTKTKIKKRISSLSKKIHLTDLSAGTIYKVRDDRKIFPDTPTLSSYYVSLYISIVDESCCDIEEIIEDIMSLNYQSLIFFKPKKQSGFLSKFIK